MPLCSLILNFAKTKITLIFSTSTGKLRVRVNYSYRRWSNFWNHQCCNPFCNRVDDRLYNTFVELFSLIFHVWKLLSQQCTILILNSSSIVTSAIFCGVARIICLAVLEPSPSLEWVLECSCQLSSVVCTRALHISELPSKTQWRSVPARSLAVCHSQPRSSLPSCFSCSRTCRRILVCATTVFLLLVKLHHLDRSTTRTGLRTVDKLVYEYNSCTTGKQRAFLKEYNAQFSEFSVRQSSEHSLSSKRLRQIWYSYEL